MGSVRCRTQRQRRRDKKSPVGCVNAQKKTAGTCKLQQRLDRQVPVCMALHHSPRKTLAMNISLHLVPIVSLLAGILILIMPRLLSTIVAVYLIMVGLVGLFGSGNFLR